MILSKPIRKQILAGKRTELRFPAPKPCPLIQGHHYVMQKDASDGSGLRLEVIAITQRGLQWICLVKLASDVPRFMAKQDGQRGQEQYVFSHQAAIDDAEVVPELDQRRISAEARKRFEALRSEDHARRQEHSLSQQLRQAQAEARAAGIDTTPEIAQIRKQIDAVREKLERAA